MEWTQKREELGHEIVKLLYRHRLILTWYRDNPQGWKLISGLWSPFYIQLRELPAFPHLLKKVGQALSEIIKQEITEVDLVVGLAMAGIPIATAISIEGQIPSAFTRKVEGVTDLASFEEAIHKYGKHSLIEGRLEDGNRLVLVDDLVTHFTSKIYGLKIVEYESQKRNFNQLSVKDVIVLLDREQGGANEAKKLGLKLHSLIPFKSKGIHWLKDDFHPKEYEVISNYLENPAQFQDPETQKDLIKASALSNR